MGLYGTVFFLLICLVALVGALLPVLPASPLIVIAALVHSLLNGFSVFSPGMIVMLGCMSLLAEGSEYCLGAAGARKYGASSLAIIGALLGMLLGVVIMGPVGLIVGPFAGAVIGEYIATRDLQKAIPAALGALSGYIGGKVLRLLITFLMCIVVVLQIF